MDTSTALIERDVPAAAASVEVAEAAWLASLPVLAATALVALVVGPLLGRALFAHAGVPVWRSARGELHPEPTEQARYLVSLAAPMLLAAAIAWAARSDAIRASLRTKRLVVASRTACMGALIGMVIAQQFVRFGSAYGPLTPVHYPYFTPPTLAFATASAALTTVLYNRGGLRRIERWLVDTRGLTITAFAVAVLVTVMWLLPGVNTAHSIVYGNPGMAFHMQFTYDESVGVLNGSFPLVNYATQYASLIPYLAAAPMTVVGPSIAAFSLSMCLLSAIAFIAVFDVLRRVSGSPLGALALYVPVVAISGFQIFGPSSRPFSYLDYFGMYPLRLAGPLVLLWTVTYGLGRAARRLWPIFLVATLVGLNNVDFGVPAFGATLVSLLWAHRCQRAAVVRLVREAATGLVGGVVLVTALTLSVGGSLPHLHYLVTYVRLFALNGYNLLPMPAVGFHLAVYGTFVAAIAVATVRSVRDAPARTLTGGLAWIGVFGLGAGGYYAGRSHPDVLMASFGPWALAVGLLIVATLPSLRGRLTVPAVGLVFALALACSAVAQAPGPWTQVARLRGGGTPNRTEFPALGTIARFVRITTTPGEHVAIALALGHAIAQRAGVVDVAPYTGFYSMPAVEQTQEMLRDLQAAGGDKIYVSKEEIWPEALDLLQEVGYVVTNESGETGVLEFARDRGS